MSWQTSRTWRLELLTSSSLGWPLGSPFGLPEEDGESFLTWLAQGFLRFFRLKRAEIMEKHAFGGPRREERSPDDWNWSRRKAGSCLTLPVLP